MKQTPESEKQTPVQRQYVYWFEETDIIRVKQTIADLGLRMKFARMSSCEALKAEADTVFIVSPEVFDRACYRQGSWYRRSHRHGQHLLVSAQRLPEEFDRFFDSEVTGSDFFPEHFPTKEEILELAESSEYTENKPPDWELIGFKDALMMKLFFTFIGIWKRGDSLKKYWKTHCAIHANFLSHRFTTEMDGEQVPYSVSTSTGVCSSCVETFNLIDRDSRKLVAPCPGAIKFGGAKKDVFLDIKPVNNSPDHTDS